VFLFVDLVVLILLAGAILNWYGRVSLAAIYRLLAVVWFIGLATGLAFVSSQGQTSAISPGFELHPFLAALPWAAVRAALLTVASFAFFWLSFKRRGAGNTLGEQLRFYERRTADYRASGRSPIIPFALLSAAALYVLFTTYAMYVVARVPFP